MNPSAQAQEPFRFYTRLHLTALTGLRALNLTELVNLMKEVPGASIYHHMHRSLQQHLSLSPEPPNDFAYWVTEILGEHELGERLASIDTVQFETIRGLREKLIETVETYLKQSQTARNRFVNPGEEFHFMKSLSFVLPTHFVAHNLAEFARDLKEVTADSIYFHIFESHLRLEKKTNDFSFWIATSLGDEKLAEKIARLDPYTQTLEDLRLRILKMVEQKI